MERGSHGAVAVEFALIVPIVLILVLGAIEFGFLTFLNASAAGAAREGARDMAISQIKSQAEAVTKASFTATTGKTASLVTVPETCSGLVTEERVTVTLEYTYPTLTGFFTFISPTFTASGIGEMRCGG